MANEHRRGFLTVLGADLGEEARHLLAAASEKTTVQMLPKKKASTSGIRNDAYAYRCSTSLTLQSAAS